MAKKTRLYEVRSKTVREKATHIYAAPTKALLNKAITSDSVVVEDITYLGWGEVEVQPDEETYEHAEFKITQGDKTVIVRGGNLGYNSLRQSFQPQVDKLEKELDPTPEDW